MRIETLPEEFIKAQPIIDTIDAAGYEAYFVGGSVRDTLLGLPIHDVDIATSAYPQEVKQLFKRTVDTGIEHGTVMILDHGTGYETTTFRTESGYQDYRRPDSVTFVRSLQEDLKRRDFTINALALRSNGTIVDYFNGLDDLKAKRIRAVGNADERFNEDALRMMRAVRFASQLDFDVDPATIQGITHHGQLLKKIAVERIHVEFVKMLQGNWPAKGFQLFLDTGLYQYCPDFKTQLPALQALTTRLTGSVGNETAVWTLICTQLGLQGRQINQFLKHWKSANHLIDDVRTATDMVLAIQADKLDDWVLYQTGEALIPIATQIATLMDATDVDATDLVARYRGLAIKSKKELAVSGQSLMAAGIKPGPILGKLLNTLEYRVATGELPNDAGKLTDVALQLVNA